MLAVAVNAAVALLHPVRVPGDLEVHQAVAVVLQVDALGSGVGGQQDAHEALCGAGLERGLDALALRVVHAAVQRQQALAGGQPLRRQDLLQPVLGGPVLGEEDHPLVGPLAVRLDDVAQPGDQGARLAVAPRRGFVGPGGHLLQQPALAGRQVGESPAGGLDRAAGRVLVFGVVGILLVDLGDLPAQDTDGGSDGRLALAVSGERLPVAGQRGRERGRRGEEPLFQQLQHELGRKLFGGVAHVLLAEAGVFAQPGVHLLLFGVVVHLDRFQPPHGKARLAIPIHQLRLQAAHHHRLQLARVRLDAAGEALVVEQLQQRGEALAVAVVRGGGQEQLMLEVRADGADRLRALRVERGQAVALRRDVVRLVHDQDIKAPGIGRLVGHHLPETAHRSFALEEIHRGDQPGEVRPGVGVDAAAAPELAHQLAVHDAELQPELVAHLVAPVRLQAGRADHQHGARPVAHDQLLNHQPGLNRLAQAHVVGDQQADPGHLHRTDERIELVILDVDPAAEGRLQGPYVGRGDRAPAHRVQEGIQSGRRVEPRWLRQLDALDRPRARLDLPDDLYAFPDCVILDGVERHQMLRRRDRRSHARLRRRQSRWQDVGHDVAPLAHGDHLALFREGIADRRRNQERCSKPVRAMTDPTKKPRPLEEGTAASLDVWNSRATMRAAMPGSWDYRRRV